MTKNWTELYKNYRGMWVALKSDETTVIASGKRLIEVRKTAVNSGYKKPIYTKIPKSDVVYIGNFR